MNNLIAVYGRYIGYFARVRFRFSAFLLINDFETNI